MRRSCGLAVVGLWFVGASAAVAQNMKSQLGTVSQIIAGTRVEIVYRRPVARGRELFGSLVSWGRVWTPSADTAARFTTTGPLEVNGSDLPAGTYSLWAIPDSTSWAIVFNRVAEVFHLRYPEGRDVLRVKVAPVSGPHVETLMFSFPVVDADSARLELRWGTTVVPLSIRAKVSP
jgi:DUF2911 family protein